MEKSARESKQSSFPLFAFVHFILLARFLSWVDGAQCLLLRFWSLLYSQSFWDSNETTEFQLSNQQGSVRESEHNRELRRDDVETVMKSLGLFCDAEAEDLQESFSLDELSGLFEEKEPSTEELQEAFSVFDENGDGYIDAKELKRVLCILGLKEGSDEENCKEMIRSFDENQDGRIDFPEFVKNFFTDPIKV